MRKVEQIVNELETQEHRYNESDYMCGYIDAIKWVLRNNAPRYTELSGISEQYEQTIKKG